MCDLKKKKKLTLLWGAARSATYPIINYDQIFWLRSINFQDTILRFCMIAPD